MRYRIGWYWRQGANTTDACGNLGLRCPFYATPQIRWEPAIGKAEKGGRMTEDPQSRKRRRTQRRRSRARSRRGR